MMPPPNVTGSLHIGHALHLHCKILLQDIKEWMGIKLFGNQELTMLEL